MQTAADFTQELYEAFECELVGKPLIESTIKEAQWDHRTRWPSITLTLESGEVFEIDVRKVKDAPPENPSTR